MHGKGYGMPSSHAQFVTFFSLSLSLFLLLRHEPHPILTQTPTTFAQRVLLSIAAIISAGAVAASRVYLNYHTPKQVLVGCAAGATFAIFWFIFTALLRSQGWVWWALDLPIAKWFRIRDLVVEEDLADSGWARWSERKAKRRAAVTKKNR
jgi:dolichyldiphosphatase